MKDNKNIQYSSFSVVEDDTQGLLKLSLAKRRGDSRSYYLRNNLDGRFLVGNPKESLKVVDALNKKLHPALPGESVMGFAEGSTILAWLLAFVRETNFVTSTKSQRSDYLNPIIFSEEHRSTDPTHFVYPIMPGDNILMIEDEISTGKTIINACRTLYEFGVSVVGIAAIVEITNFYGKDTILKETGLSVVSATKIELHEDKN